MGKLHSATNGVLMASRKRFKRLAIREFVWATWLSTQWMDSPVQSGYLILTGRLRLLFIHTFPWMALM
ncbi:hypothetical protein BS330_24945 [Amycolatopsis keratiniphila subsp. nogabecina]|nr:hypothetical protein BS330_24945 [Amycolatopsis keratiniphila subsp. nogabecina]